MDATAAALGVYRAAVAKEHQASAAANTTYLAAKGQTLKKYEGQAAILATFGLQETVRKVPTPATKAAAAAKRKAKRDAKKAANAAAATAPAPAAAGSGTTTAPKG